MPGSSPQPTAIRLKSPNDICGRQSCNCGSGGTKPASAPPAASRHGLHATAPRSHNAVRECRAEFGAAYKSATVTRKRFASG